MQYRLGFPLITVVGRSIVAIIFMKIL